MRNSKVSDRFKLVVRLGCRTSSEPRCRQGDGNMGNANVTHSHVTLRSRAESPPLDEVQQSQLSQGLLAKLQISSLQLRALVMHCKNYRGGELKF